MHRLPHVGEERVQLCEGLEQHAMGAMQPLVVRELVRQLRFEDTPLSLRLEPVRHEASLQLQCTGDALVHTAQEGRGGQPSEP